MHHICNNPPGNHDKSKLRPATTKCSRHRSQTQTGEMRTSECKRLEANTPGRWHLWLVASACRPRDMSSNSPCSTAVRKDHRTRQTDPQKHCTDEPCMFPSCLTEMLSKPTRPGLFEGDKDSARCLFLLIRGFGEGTSVGATPLM